MNGEPYRIDVPKGFNGKTLRDLGLEFRSMGYVGGASLKTGEYVFVSGDGKRIEVTPPKNSNAPGFINYQDPLIRDRIKDILNRVGGSA